MTEKVFQLTNPLLQFNTICHIIVPANLPSTTLLKPMPLLQQGYSTGIGNSK